jgi:hypothetical protein
VVNDEGKLSHAKLGELTEDMILDPAKLGIKVGTLSTHRNA